MLTLNIKDDLNSYLEESEHINHQHPEIKALADKLAQQATVDERPQDVAISDLSFKFVRDQIKHSADFKIDQITCRASDVLKYETGYCYAKSHLLAALLRANSIPAGLCYQRLSIELDEQYCSTSKLPFCLHGLNAVYLNDCGWYRMDPRGNKLGVNSTFAPPFENLAFSVDSNKGEVDFPTVYQQPIDEVVDFLNQFNSYAEANYHLPDKH